MIRVKIDTEPVAKGRPRVTLEKGFPRIYTPHKTKETEQAIYEEVDEYMNTNNIEPFPAGVPLILEVTFYKRKPRWLLASNDIPTKHPDIDNYVKTVLDACNGLAYHDDGQITTVIARKRYSPKSLALSRKAVRTPESRGFIKLKISEDRL